MNRHETEADLVLVLHGPNLNMLGSRQPEYYGSVTLQQVNETLQAEAVSLRLRLDIMQSNHEGGLIDRLQCSKAAAVIINAGALSHYSRALADALCCLDAFKVEVHLSNIHAREDFRKISVTAEAVNGMICGFGLQGYLAALRLVAERLKTGN